MLEFASTFVHRRCAFFWLLLSGAAMFALIHPSPVLLRVK